jgi:DNA repair protein RadA/Sms
LTFGCVHCGARAQPIGDHCALCGSLGTLAPELAGEETPAPAAQTMSLAASEVADPKYRPTSTGFAQWDKALGGGLIRPCSMLLYGPPGSKKTTYAAAIANHVARRLGGVGLYLCGEMPTSAVKVAAKRMAPDCDLLFAGSDRGATDWNRCAAEVLRVRPRVVVYDSLQAIDARGEVAGSMRAVRAALRGLLNLRATLEHIAIAVSQVNAEGQPAGPRRAKHDCDVTARLEIESLTIEKNRFFPSPVRVSLLEEKPAARATRESRHAPDS